MFQSMINFDEIVINFLKDAPVLTGVDAQIVLYELYEIESGIYNHLNKIEKRPLSGVAFHDCEENTKTSILHTSIDQYAALGIREHFGMSLVEYLNLPQELCLKIIETCKDIIRKKSGIVDQIQQDLGKPIK